MGLGREGVLVVLVCGRLEWGTKQGMVRCMWLMFVIFCCLGQELPFSVWEIPLLNIEKSPWLALPIARVWTHDLGCVCHMPHPNLWTDSQKHQEADTSETLFRDGGSHRANIQPPGFHGSGRRSLLDWVYAPAGSESSFLQSFISYLVSFENSSFST